MAGNPYPAVYGRVAGVADVFGADVPAAVAPTTDVEGGMAAAARLMDSLEASGDLATGDGGLPTAILAQSDLLAVGVMRAAQEAGLRVPQDVSVTGFDGIPLDWWDGTLTTVVRPGTGKGEAAGHAIRELLDGGQPSGVVLPTHVRVGTSSGPPRADLRTSESALDRSAAQGVEGLLGEDRPLAHVLRRHLDPLPVTGRPARLQRERVGQARGARRQEERHRLTAQPRRAACPRR